MMLNPAYSMNDTIVVGKTVGFSEEMILADIEERILLGQDINQRSDNGSTPIKNAAAQGYLTVVKKLFEAGADLTVKNKYKEDALSSAKFSGNKELILFIKSALKGGAVSTPPETLYFRPKVGKEAEYTFVPSAQFKKQHESEEIDVGYFLKDSEVLKLETTKKSTTKGGVKTIFIEEGKVTIHADSWDEINEVEMKKTVIDTDAIVHDIGRIVEEYLSD